MLPSIPYVCVSMLNFFLCLGFCLLAMIGRPLHQMADIYVILLQLLQHFHHCSLSWFMAWKRIINILQWLRGCNPAMPPIFSGYRVVIPSMPTVCCGCEILIFLHSHWLLVFTQAQGVFCRLIYADRHYRVEEYKFLTKELLGQISLPPAHITAMP